MLAAEHEGGLTDAVGVRVVGRWTGSVVGRQCSLTPVAKSFDQMTYSALSQGESLGDPGHRLSRPPAVPDHPTDRDRDGARHETLSRTKPVVFFPQTHDRGKTPVASSGTR
jgi:hypothetical protein